MSKKNKKAFVDGVNVLDSNPKAYKYVKKKIKSAGDGEKLDLTPLDLDTLYKKYKEVGNNRYMDTLLLRQVDNLLRKRKMGKPQRLAIFVTAGQEGSTIKSHGNGAVGLVGWRGTRAENLPSTAEGQADKIYNETYGPFSNDNWNHGGLGSGYKTAREALLAFLNATTPEEAIKALNFGYVRPPKSETLYRINLMKKLYKKGGLIPKAQKGSIMQWLNNNSDLVKGGLSLLGNGISSVINSSKAADYSLKIDKEIKAGEKALYSLGFGDAYLKGLIAAKYYLQPLEGVHYGDIDMLQFAMLYALGNMDLSLIEKFKMDKMAEKQEGLNKIYEQNSKIGQFINNGLNTLGEYIGKKKEDSNLEFNLSPAKTVTKTEDKVENPIKYNFGLDTRFKNPSWDAVTSIVKGESLNDYLNRNKPLGWKDYNFANSFGTTGLGYPMFSKAPSLEHKFPLQK